MGEGNLSRIEMVVQHKLVMPLLNLRRKIAARRAPRVHPMVNVGGGYFLRPGWLSLDYSSPSYPYDPRYLDINWDLTKPIPLPFADNSVACFYSQHTFEHLPVTVVPHLFREFHRCLRPGGVLRISVPDYDKAHAAYMANDVDAFDGIWIRKSIEHAFVATFATAYASRIDRKLIRDRILSSEPQEFAEYCYEQLTPEDLSIFHNHNSWWTFSRFHSLLSAASFTNIENSTAQGSRVPDMRGNGNYLGIQHITKIDRLNGFDTAHPEMSVYVEAIKDALDPVSKMSDSNIL